MRKSWETRILGPDVYEGFLPIRLMPGKAMLDSSQLPLAQSLRLCAVAVAAFAAFSVIPARADWGPWKTIGDGFVKVEFSQVDNDTCTWRIKNSGSTTLTRFDFSYTFSPADKPNSQETDKDVLPFPLKAGAMLGGGAVYSANTRRCPATLDVLKLEREQP